MRLLFIGIVFLGGLTSFLSGQDKSQQPSSANTSCTFKDGKQISLRYQHPSADEHELQDGKLYAPGNSPMLLFTQTGLSVGDSEIPAGAFSVYVIPEKEKWTLVVNKNVNPKNKYDEKQDLFRAPMQVGDVSTKGPFQILFVHIAPKQCNMRIYQGKHVPWAEFKEK